MKFTQLKSSLASAPPEFGYYLTGDDEYVRSRAVSLITAGAELPELNVVTLDQPSSGEVADALSAMPVMSEKRFVVVRTLSEAEELTGYPSDPNPLCVLVVCPGSKRSVRIQINGIDDFHAQHIRQVDEGIMEQHYGNPLRALS